MKSHLRTRPNQNRPLLLGTFYNKDYLHSLDFSIHSRLDRDSWVLERVIPPIQTLNTKFGGKFFFFGDRNFSEISSYVRQTRRDGEGLCWNVRYQHKLSRILQISSDSFWNHYFELFFNKKHVQLADSARTDMENVISRWNFLEISMKNHTCHGDKSSSKNCESSFTPFVLWHLYKPL